MGARAVTERHIVIRAISLFALGAAVFCAVFACASRAVADLPQAIDSSGQSVDLPSPPDPLARLVEIGNVRFEFYDPRLEKPPFAGETKFEFRYTFNSRSRWKLVHRQDQYAIELSVQYRQVELQRTHRVLLPEEMIGDDLFQQRLTLHEFDHLAISCDPRLPALLESMLKTRNAKIVMTLDEAKYGFSGEPTSAELTRISKRLVQEASDRVFEDFVAIVSIRYRELDRVSDSGRKPLRTEDRERIIDAPPTP